MTVHASEFEMTMLHYHYFRHTVVSALEEINMNIYYLVAVKTYAQTCLKHLGDVLGDRMRVYLPLLMPDSTVLMGNVFSSCCPVFSLGTWTAVMCPTL